MTQEVQSLQEGDLVWFREATIKGLWKYRHWAVYIGNGAIVHIQDTEQGHIIIQEILEDYVRQANRRCNFGRHEPSPASRPANEVIERATSCIGKDFHYHPIFNNCEHFAKWCKYGERSSTQVDVGMAAWGTGVGVLVGGVAGVGLGVGVVCGSVATLATCGIAGGVIAVTGISTYVWTARKLRRQKKVCNSTSVTRQVELL